MGILFKSKKGHELHAIGGLSEKPLYRGSLLVIQRNKTYARVQGLRFEEIRIKTMSVV